MPKKIVRYKCSVCGYEHDTLEMARQCEAMGEPDFSFEIGQRIDAPKGRRSTTIYYQILKKKIWFSKNQFGIKHVAAYQILFFDDKNNRLHWRSDSGFKRFLNY